MRRRASDRGPFVSVRILGMAILTLSAMTGTVRASSFVIMGNDAPSSTPSIIMLGMPASSAHAEADEKVLATPSIIALGEPVPDVTYEQVAAIPQKPIYGPVFSPMVIRGGIVGGAFSPATQAVPAAATSEPAQEASGSKSEEPLAPPPVDPHAPPPYLPPNGLGKHRY